MPGGGIGRDVIRGIGHRRSSRHRSIPQVRRANDPFAVELAETGIANSIRRDQAMLAARRHDHGVYPLILSIDGLPPERGNEMLSVVRELTGTRV